MLNMHPRRAAGTYVLNLTGTGCMRKAFKLRGPGCSFGSRQPKAAIGRRSGYK